MIRKWLKLNSCFVELLTNPAASKTLKHRWAFDHPCRSNSCSAPDEPPSTLVAIPIAPSPSPVAAAKPVLHAKTLSDPKDRGDAQFPPAEACAVAETPAQTDLFEIKGPSSSAFLIEVHSRDLESVMRDLIRLKGDFFHFDKTVLAWFTMKCILAAEPFCGMGKDQTRLAKVHAISSGCEEVYVLDGMEKFFFVNSIENMARAKKILEKLGYKISGILYRFQPREKINLEERHRDICMQFLGAVQHLPKVLSVTHNLNTN